MTMIRLPKSDPNAPYAVARKNPIGGSTVILSLCNAAGEFIGRVHPWARTLAEWYERGAVRVCSNCLRDDCKGDCEVTE